MEPKRYNVKITVLKRSLNEDFCEKYADSMWEACETFAEGQEFIADGVTMPDGFCGWAYSDIEKIILTLARGGNFVGMPVGTFVTCCTDGYRPVFFRLERIGD